MKREKEKVKGVTEILCKAKFSREFFASYLYENFFVDTIGWIEKILLVLLLINVKLKIFFYKRKISFLFLYKNTQYTIYVFFFSISVFIEVCDAILNLLNLQLSFRLILKSIYIWSVALIPHRLAIRCWIITQLLTCISLLEQNSN